MISRRALVLALLVAVSMTAVPLSAAAVDPGSQHAEENVSETADPETPPATVTNVTYVGEDDDPSTNRTIGYVEGIRYDDELPIDERDDAVVAEAELEAVVYRSMARIEVLRELTFEEDVPVEVSSREEFQEETEQRFENVTDEERLAENLRFEALFMVDRETDAVAASEALYGGAANGYYDPNADEIVLVSNDPETPALNEVILAHELLHALQDQRFDLQRYERQTQDQHNAKNGLIEGDAVWVETEYEERCEETWVCVLPSDDEAGEGVDESLSELPAEFNWGIYFTLYQPYSDGPAYIEYLLEEGGWDAVNAAYDEPPASSSEVIRPGEEREPAPIEFEDTSSDDWNRLELENETAYESFGEAAMVSMLSHGALDRSADASVVTLGEFVATDEQGYIDSIEYDQPYTNGWAGDTFVAYATDAETIDESGYVWQTTWTSVTDAEAFADGYLELLAINGAVDVDDRQDTFVIETGFPGAYYVDIDGETVTIVRGPSVDALPKIYEGAAPDGEDRLDFEIHAIEPGDADDEVRGFGVTATVVALLIAMAIRRR
ncbi:Hvo_1808 family surface protein [Natronobeatus ordinarius]|uniref:Hvo_1808 family surface protein n=1 Tax=Natronobeatus ordinarius TaxID=2963433 RepID=UPI0020CFC3EF|nr:Hvo_1808 family surface protein [Natronobeatus ordinarius]